MDSETEDLFNHLKTEEVDPLLILYLQLPPIIIRDYPELTRLLHICESKGFKKPEELKILFNKTRNFFQQNGINPISPGRFIMARTKTSALQEYNSIKSSWPLHVPFMFQTFDEDMKDMIMFICANPQDTIIKMHDILKFQNVLFKHASYRVCGIIEHSIDNSSLTRQIFDCETTLDPSTNPHSREFITSLMEEIPRTLSLKFSESKIMPEESFVTFDTKNRSRDIGDVFKASNHITTNIFAPRFLHDRAMTYLIGPYSSFHQQTRDKTFLPSLSKEKIDSLTSFEKSLFVIDPAALPGKKNGITTSLSRKKNGDPYPVFEKREINIDGITETVIYHPLPIPQDFSSNSLNTQERYALLCNLSLTIPPFNTDVLSYKDSFISIAMRNPSFQSQV